MERLRDSYLEYIQWQNIQRNKRPSRDNVKPKSKAEKVKAIMEGYLGWDSSKYFKT